MNRNDLAFRMNKSTAIACVRHKFNLLRPIMDERMRRRWAASEAMLIGRGGIVAVAQATGLSSGTIHKGIAELRDPKRRDGEKPNTPARRMNGPTHPGRPYKLTGEQLVELEELMLKGATAHGWPNDLWTLN